MANYNKRRRNSLRYPGYDYTSCGGYFVTICTHWGRHLFGRVKDQEMILNVVGRIADQCWLEIPKHYPFVELDEHVIMPNHMHGCLNINKEIEQDVEWQELVQKSVKENARSGFTAARRDPVTREFGNAITGSLSTIIGSYKAAVSRQVNDLGIMPERMRWHRNFWDHIVRNDDEYERIRSYTRNNPARWLADALHPNMPLNKFNQEWRETREYKKWLRENNGRDPYDDACQWD